jgi:hypothetical protein
MFEDEEFAAEVERRIPGGEIAAIEDVSAAIVYLVTDRARR